MKFIDELAVPRLSSGVAVALILFGALSGCVERKERLTISAEGSVLYQVVHETESLDDLYDGDAVPMIAGGWVAEEQELHKEPSEPLFELDESGQPRERQDDDVDVTYRLVAEAAFPPGSDLPSNFALPHDLDGDLYLQFPTGLAIENRSDGVYYHFCRVYPAREWQQIALLHERLLEIPLDDLTDIDPREWTSQQRMTAVQAYATFETEKTLVFARQAFKQAAPGLPQDAWLDVRADILDCLAHLEYEEMAKLIEPRETNAEKEIQERMLDQAKQKFESDMLEHLKQALRDRAGYDEPKMNRFMRQFERARLAYKVSEDLGDDRFQVAVEMPGEIVASNADEVAGKVATWSFDGQALRDRELELMATSRLVD